MWDPFKDIEQAMKQMGATGRVFASTASGWLPAMDVLESDTGYRVVSDLAGVKKDDMNVVMEENRLCISGNRPIPEWAQKDHFALMSERGYGRFERCLQMPTRVAESSLRAALSDGVLEISMDKVKASNATRAGSQVRID